MDFSFRFTLRLLCLSIGPVPTDAMAPLTGEKGGHLRTPCGVLLKATWVLLFVFSPRNRPPDTKTVLIEGGPLRRGRRLYADGNYAKNPKVAKLSHFTEFERPSRGNSLQRFKEPN